MTSVLVRGKLCLGTDLVCLQVELLLLGKPPVLVCLAWSPTSAGSQLVAADAGSGTLLLWWMGSLAWNQPGPGYCLHLGSEPVEQKLDRHLPLPPPPLLPSLFCVSPSLSLEINKSMCFFKK